MDGKSFAVGLMAAWGMTACANDKSSNSNDTTEPASLLESESDAFPGIGSVPPDLFDPVPESNPQHGSAQIIGPETSQTRITLEVDGAEGDATDGVIELIGYQDGTRPEQQTHVMVRSAASDTLWIQALRIDIAGGIEPQTPIAMGSASRSLYAHVAGRDFVATSGTLTVARASAERLRLLLDEVVLQQSIAGESESGDETVLLEGAVEGPIDVRCFVAGSGSVANCSPGTDCAGAEAVSDTAVSEWTLDESNAAEFCQALVQIAAGVGMP
jgi:hypothetical protein